MARQTVITPDGDRGLHLHLLVILDQLGMVPAAATILHQHNATPVAPHKLGDAPLRDALRCGQWVKSDGLSLPTHGQQ